MNAVESMSSNIINNNNTKSNKASICLATDRLSVLLHHNMAVVGGFMGCYAVLLRADFLGNAQTSNILYIVLAIFGGNIKEFAIRLIAALIYLSGGVLFTILNHKTNNLDCNNIFSNYLNVKYISLFVDILAIALLAFMPENINPIIGLYPIFFAMSFQWNCFPGHYGYVSSTIFSTNNIRQVSLSLGEFICDKDTKHLHKTKFFLGSLLGFHIGVAYAYVCVTNYGIKSIWFNLFPVFIGFLLQYRIQKINNN